MLLSKQAINLNEKRGTIPGVPKGSSIGYMYIGEYSPKHNYNNPGVSAAAMSKVGNSLTLYFEGFNPLISGVIFIVMLTVGLIIGLTINYKTRLLINNSFKVSGKQKQQIENDFDVELGLPSVKLKSCSGIELDNKYELRRFPEAKIQSELETKRIYTEKHNSLNIDSQRQSFFDQGKLKPISNKLSNNDHKTNGNKSTNIINVEISETKLANLYKSMTKLQKNKALNIYSGLQMQKYYIIADYEKEMNLTNIKKCPITLPMQPFEDANEIKANINSIKPLLLGSNLINEINTLEIFMFKLSTMIVNSDENGYVFHPDFCKLMENYLDKGIILDHFFLTNNYLLQDCLISCLLGYFWAHWDFPIFGHTSFINFKFRSIKNMNKEPFCQSHSLILNMVLNLHINFEEKYKDKIEEHHLNYLLAKLNIFLENSLNMLSNKTDFIDQIILKFIKAIELVMDTSTKKTFIYLQSILRIYNSHLICCLKKKNNAHIALETDNELFQVLLTLLNHGNLTINIKKLIQAISLLIGRKNCPLEFLNKLDEVINNENENPNKGKNVMEQENKLPIIPINIRPGSWV